MRTKRSWAKSRLVPTLRYRDPTAAIEWLCAALGFQRHHVVTAEDGTIVYAQLIFGDDIMVLSSANSPADDDVPKLPRKVISGVMQSCYFVVDDIDRHYRCAKEQGADILDDLGDYDFIGRGYSCRDPEGQVWSFGTRDPREWKPDGMTRRSSAAAILGRRLGVRVSIVAIAATTTAWMFFALPQFPSSGIEKSNSVLGQQRADEGTARVVLKTAEPVDTTELAAGTTAAPLRAVADVERGPDAAIEVSPMKVPPFSVMSDHEASALKPPQPVADKDTTQHPENDAIKQQAPDQVAKEEAERSAAAAQQRQTREQIPDTNAVAPPNERSTEQPQPIVMRKLASGTTAAPLHAVADVERSPDVATEQSPMKAPPFSAMAHHEASPLKQQPIGGEDPTQHREGDAIKKPAPAPVAKEEAERSAAAPQQRQIHEKIPDTNAVAPPNERSTRQSPKRKAVAQFWQCLPRPPTGEVVCRPITRRSRQ